MITENPYPPFVSCTGGAVTYRTHSISHIISRTSRSRIDRVNNSCQPPVILVLFISPAVSIHRMSVVPFIHLPPRSLVEDSVLHHQPVDIGSLGTLTPS